MIIEIRHACAGASPRIGDARTIGLHSIHYVDLARTIAGDA